MSASERASAGVPEDRRRPPSLEYVTYPSDRGVSIGVLYDRHNTDAEHIEAEASLFVEVSR